MHLLRGLQLFTTDRPTPPTLSLSRCLLLIVTYLVFAAPSADGYLDGAFYGNVLISL